MQDVDEFTEALEMELRRRGFGFERWALTGFVKGSWLLIQEDPSPEHLAHALMGTSSAAVRTAAPPGRARGRIAPEYAEAGA